MKILISGASGLVGSALTPRLREGGHEVVPLARGAEVPRNAVRWDPATGSLDAEATAGCEAVVHLAGENVAGGRWSTERMVRIRDSRVRGTETLVSGLLRMSEVPEVLVMASATGAYGDRGDEILTEESPLGEGFLADVVRDWEAASEPLAEVGCRVVRLRIGVVLAREGGALPKMLPAFRLGLGGPIGSGEQYWPWLTLDELCAIVERALGDQSLSGVYHAVAPNPVTNREFTKTLGRVLRRPTAFRVPVFVARAAFGRMADALLLSSQRAVPERLQDAGYEFRDPVLESALRRLLT